MNTDPSVALKQIFWNDSSLPAVIQFSIGASSPEKIFKIMKSYDTPHHKLLGALKENTLIGVLGFFKSPEIIIIRHISVVPNLQRQGIGTCLMDKLKACFKKYPINAETDEEAVGFYIKSGFRCDAFQGSYGNLRYQCLFHNKD
jgi:GNAT superfamily N-acetyltransferase